MIELISQAPEEFLPVIELYLVAALTETRKLMRMAALRDAQKHAPQSFYKAMRRLGNGGYQRIAGGASVDQVIAWMQTQAPYPTHEQAQSHLDLAAKVAKKDRHAVVGRLVRAGYRNAEIAAAVGISISSAAKIAARELKGGL